MHRVLVSKVLCNAAPPNCQGGIGDLIYGLIIRDYYWGAVTKVVDYVVAGSVVCHTFDFEAPRNVQIF
jgi:hypothetical protein